MDFIRISSKRIPCRFLNDCIFSIRIIGQLVFARYQVHLPFTSLHLAVLARTKWRRFVFQSPRTVSPFSHSPALPLSSRNILIDFMSEASFLSVNNWYKWLFDVCPKHFGRLSETIPTDVRNHSDKYPNICLADFRRANALNILQISTILYTIAVYCYLTSCLL